MRPDQRQYKLDRKFENEKHARKYKKVKEYGPDQNRIKAYL